MATDSNNDPAGHEVTERLRRQGDGETLDYGDTAVLDEKMRTRSVPSLPARLGRYRITDTLGEGGMGVVYAAIDEQLERPIAVKVLRPESAADQTARERFWREARLAASVNHPHVCQLYEIGESDGRLFMAMERLEGEPLSERLSRGAVPLAETVQIGLEVLDALETLHRRGIAATAGGPASVGMSPVRRRWPRIFGRRSSRRAAKADIARGLSRGSWCCRSGC